MCKLKKAALQSGFFIDIYLVDPVNKGIF